MSIINTYRIHEYIGLQIEWIVQAWLLPSCNFSVGSVTQIPKNSWAV